MLEGLRVARQSWVGRIIIGLVMGFIAITFAVWGIGNDMLSGFASHRLARVGAAEVTIEAYKAAYQNELLQLQQQTRRAITKEEALRAGLHQRVLDRLVTDAALDQKARALGLAISDEGVQTLLKAEKVFQGASGQFDPVKFKQIIGAAGFSERSFLLDQKTAYLRKALTDTVSLGVEPPRLMVEAIHRFRNETRAIDYFVLPLASVGAMPTPSEEETKKYYEDHEQAFRAKEYRAATALAVTAATLAKPAEVAEADVRKLYDEVKSKRFGTPEKREIRQIVFKSEVEAREAHARLKGGVSFDALIAERKVNEKDASLGMVEARDFGDPKVADAAFALKAPGVAEPVPTAFGTVVSEVRKIAPGVYSKSYEQAAAELRMEIAALKAAPEAGRLREAIEDQRASGKPLAEAAKAVGLETIAIESIDDAGRDKAGKDAAAGLPGGADLVKAIFASDVGVDNDTVATRDGGSVWFEVANIEQARQMSFEEVKGAVEAAMRAAGAQKALTAKADDVVEGLRSGRPLDDLAQAMRQTPKRATDVKRAAHPDFNTASIVQFFDTAPHGAGSAATDAGRLVFFVKDSATPKFDPDSIEAKTIAEQLKPSLVNDLLEQYVGGLEKTLGVEINQGALQAATGAESEK